MNKSRILALIALLVAVVAVAIIWSRIHPVHRIGDHVTVYYTKQDGTTEVPWTLSMRPPTKGESSAERLRQAVLYAATQAVAGPPSNVAAVRFPPGTHVLSADVTNSTAVVNLSPEVKSQTGAFTESGEFKSLVWTLTALPGITQVAVRVDGAQLPTLPGGELELDGPLRRSDW